LRAGTDGQLAALVHAVSGADGQPVNAMYFWMTGLLSSFLDNAPPIWCSSIWQTAML
jgi:Na+/H+ antiporter NhaD/arsenite permease-like protein